MNIIKCLGYDCYKEKLPCFVDCNNMYVNTLMLKQIHDKVNRYNNLLDAETDNHIINLKKDFQNRFVALCVSFENEYDKIISAKTENK